MRISREWLEQYIDLTGIDDNALTTSLTGIGLEVEHVERVSPVPAGVVVGRITKHEPLSFWEKSKQAQLMNRSCLLLFLVLLSIAGGSCRR